MDTNRDGVITRAEWRGSARSFEVHDWNGDGVLSGEEVRIGGQWPTQQQTSVNDWSRERFRWLDTNNDNRISRSEWRYEIEDFFRVDRNGDNRVVLSEFLVGDVDDDRGDRFDFLDVNSDNRLDRAEWHGSLVTFRALDRNRDNLLSRQEVTGVTMPGTTDPAYDDPLATQTIIVSGRQAWVDTGIDLRAGDVVSVTATGSVAVTGRRDVIADPNGATGYAATSRAPLPHIVIGALLGRIGTNEPFVVGTNLSSMRVTQAGRLFLGVNDDVLSDNSGEFRASVTVTRR
jgi:hypothetical protein